MLNQENILDVAIKRFSHFGIHKTTLTEIAEDLAVSKQALFYHYADKQSLVMAVEDKIVNEYIQVMNDECMIAGTLREALYKMIEIRSYFFEKYYMLATQLELSDPNLSADRINAVKEKLLLKQNDLFVLIFNKGIANGELNSMPPAKIRAVILETLSALAMCFRHKTIIPEMHVFREILDRQKEVMDLFYHGLKNLYGSGSNCRNVNR